MAHKNAKYFNECKQFVFMPFSGKKYYRAVFKSPVDADTPNVVEREISLNYGLNQEYCSKEVIYLKSLQDIQSRVSWVYIYLDKAQESLHIFVFVFYRFHSS